MLKVYKRKMEDVTVLCLQGRLITGQTGTLQDAVNGEENGSAVILDMARVSRIDAGGLGVLLELRAQTLAKGLEFKLMNVTKLVQQVFVITRLDSVFDILVEKPVPTATFRGRPAMVLQARRCA